MNDYFEDFDGDYDDGFDDENDADDDGFSETFSESKFDEPGNDDEDLSMEAEDHCSGIQWHDWMLLGPISEEMAREKAEQERLLRENDKNDN